MVWQKLLPFAATLHHASLVAFVNFMPPSTFPGVTSIPSAVFSQSFKRLRKPRATGFISLRSVSFDPSQRISIRLKNIPKNLKQYFDDAMDAYPDDPGFFALSTLRNDMAAREDIFKSRDEIIKGSDEIIKSLEVVITTKDALIALQENMISDLKMNVLWTEIKFQAVDAGQIILETACKSYAINSPSLSTFSARFCNFRDNVLLDKQTEKLSKDSTDCIADLAKCGIDVDPTQVVNKLSNVQTLSKPYHILPISLNSGAYIGGGETVTTATLAMCLLRLQEQGHCSSDVTVLDSLGASKCLLSSGKVTCNQAQTPPPP